MGDKFIEQDMGCQFIKNCSLTLMLGLLFLSFAIIVRILNYFLRKVKSKSIRDFINKLLNGPLGLSGLFSFLAMWDIDIFIAAATNNKY